jgi:hypothetical protein
MVRIDSNKVRLPLDCLKTWNKDSFIDTIKNKGGNELSRKYRVDNIKPGLKSIEINPTQNTVIIESSAKILRDSYLDGINLNTVENWVNEINTTNLIHIFPEGISQAEYLTADVTQNIKWNKTSFSDLFYSLQLSCINQKYKSELWNKKNNQGLAFTGNQTTLKSRLILYNKYLDLITNKPNKELLKLCNNPNKLINSAKEIIRVEQNTTTFKSLRKRFNIHDNNLLSVLGSNENPNYKLLDSITTLHSLEQMELFARYKDSDLTIGAIVRMEGMRNIIEKCAMDLNLVQSFLKSIDSKNWDAWYYDRNSNPGFKTILLQMRFENKKNLNYYSNIQDFKELLKVA